jgi:hypothetical protein
LTRRSHPDCRAIDLAFDKLSAPIFINQYYIQPYETGTVALALGSVQSFLASTTDFKPGAIVVGGFYMDRGTAINLAAFLHHYCKATDEEIKTATALATQPAPGTQK